MAEASEDLSGLVEGAVCLSGQWILGIMCSVSALGRLKCFPVASLRVAASPAVVPSAVPMPRRRPI